MFDSGIKASELIEQIKDEADIAIPISDEVYISWLNALEQLLYSEIIKEQKKYMFSKYSSLFAPKLNFFPIFAAQTINDVIVTIDSPGTYRMSPTSKVSMTTSKGATLEAVITLPAGTYTLSDNAKFNTTTTSHLGSLTAFTVAGTFLADISSSPTAAGYTFTLNAETQVRLRFSIPAGTKFPSGDYVFSPQLEAGNTKTAFVRPIASYTELPHLVCSFPKNDDEADMRFEDVHAVYADSTQLIKSTLTSGAVFPNSYYRDDNKLAVNVVEFPEEFKVVYIVRPKLKTTSNYEITHVMLPAEFIDLAKAKLRGEAYKLANEYELSAMWLNDYNTLLETFKAWISGKQPKFGM